MPDAVAITRAVSAALGDCELTCQPRVPIDVELARVQHAAYERALAAAGYRVERLATDAAMPDSVFVEDLAIVFDELAILTHPGADSRRREMPAIAAALAAYRPLQQIQPPGVVRRPEETFKHLQRSHAEHCLRRLRLMWPGPTGWTP